jgi:hypothetical protein
MLTVLVRVDVGIPAKVALRKMYWLCKELDAAVSDDNFNGCPLIIVPGQTVTDALANRARLRKALELPEEGS